MYVPLTASAQSRHRLIESLPDTQEIPEKQMVTNQVIWLPAVVNVNMATREPARYKTNFKLLYQLLKSIEANRTRQLSGTPRTVLSQDRTPWGQWRKITFLTIVMFLRNDTSDFPSPFTYFLKLFDIMNRTTPNLTSCLHWVTFLYWPVINKTPLTLTFH